MHMSLVVFAVLANFISNVACHGSMVMPINWFDHKIRLRIHNVGVISDYIGIRAGMQCYAGGDFPREKVCPSIHGGCVMYAPGASCFWYKNNTRVDRPRIFDPNLRTYKINSKYSYYRHPWRSPGRAPVDSPCGVAGGNINGCGKDKCNYKQGGFEFGVKAENYNYTYKPFVTKWKRGDIVEVAWAITANHGGGYSYRLCKVPKKGISFLTEKCFQEIPLDFVGDIQWVQYGKNESTRVSFPAVRTRNGTYPNGSQWTKNPIPACKGKLGGFLSPTSDCPKGTQFKPPRPELYGYGISALGTVDNFNFSIIDKVKVPDHLPAGEYVLSFRWDCEQTNQVWNTCASIELS